MDSAVFEELLVSALETPAKKTLDNLLAQLASAGNPIPAATVEALNVLWEAWNNDDLDDAQGEFCIGVAALPMTDSPLFRKLLPGATRAVLPPYLTRNPIMKTLGVRDENVSLAEFSQRLRKLIGMKNGIVIFLPSSGRWGMIGAIDNINASVSVGPFSNIGSSAAVPLEIVLREAILLTTGPELFKLTDARNPISATEFRMLAAKKALVPPTEDEMRIMAQAGCARLMRDKVQFDKYWNNTTASASAGATRRACNGRSLKEMDLLLTTEAEKGEHFSDEDVEAFRTFFTNLKQDTANRDSKLLASCVAQIAPRATAAQLKHICEPLLGKAPFWPAEPQSVNLNELSVWGELPAKSLEKLASATAVIFPEEYLAKCAMRLPLKSLNSVLAPVGDELLYDIFYDHKLCSADLLLWAWKNRKKRSEELLKLVNVDNVARALSVDNLPKAWGAAMRELRALLMDDANFQKQLIAAADGDAMMFAAVLQGALFLSSGERQSLMVKLARVSPLLRDYLENGAGQRILKAGIGVSDDNEPVSDEPNYTSVSSHQRLIRELDDLINVQVPENREALKTARAHGDFRENSEFDAAKERRNFLSRRRSELERELAHIQPLNIASVKVEKTAVIGSEIELKYDNGEVEVYQLLGAWDGDPERKFLSYRTRLGAAVINHKQGDSFEIPGGRKCTLTTVRPLAAEIIEELDRK